MSLAAGLALFKPTLGYISKMLGYTLVLASYKHFNWVDRHFGPDSNSPSRNFPLRLISRD